MAEILGVLASATQLAQYALKISAAISAIHDRVHNAGELRKAAVQVQLLLDTALQIQQNPQAYNSYVYRHLASATDEAKSLLELLERLSTNYSRGSVGKRYYKAARGSKDEKEIAKGFKRLEQEKTSLLVCISIANNERLSSIKTESIEITDGMPSSVVEEPVVTPQQQGCILDGNGTKRIQGALALRGHSYPQNEPTGQTRQQPENNGQRLAQEYPQQHQPGAFAQIETSHERCSVFGENSQTKQHNGHLGIPLVAKATYTDCQVVGKGAQFNGSASGEHGLELAKSFFGSGKS